MSDGISTMVRFLTSMEDGPGLARHCLRQAGRRRDELIECSVGFSEVNSPQQRRLYYFEISVDRIAFNCFTPSLIWFFSNAV
jgi:hypothetical protein